MSNILLIITSSIAAVKAPEIISSLREKGHNVTCVVTESAKYFVTSESLKYLTQNRVYDNMFEDYQQQIGKMPHIELSRDNEIILAAPASADFIGKVANGLADDLATAICLASNKKIIFAPAMNKEMWLNKAFQRNLKQVKEDGHQIIEPESGKLACGEEGIGRMASVDSIAEFVENGQLKEEKIFKGKSFLITAGPTRENIDPVRYISNYSSGKQGYELANIIAKKGGDVTLISGPTDIPAPKNVKLIKVNSAMEMLHESTKNLPANVAICVAAVSDWRPEEEKKNKIKKKQGEASNLALSLIENPDILSEISKKGKKRPQLVIGFAAETEHVVENAMVKIERKGCDLIIANDVSEGRVFNEDDNEVYIISSEGLVEKIEKNSKINVAEKITQQISNFLNK